MRLMTIATTMRKFRWPIVSNGHKIIYIHVYKYICLDTMNKHTDYDNNNIIIRCHYPDELGLLGVSIKHVHFLKTYSCTSVHGTYFRLQKKFAICNFHQKIKLFKTLLNSFICKHSSHTCTTLILIPHTSYSCNKTIKLKIRNHTLLRLLENNSDSPRIIIFSDFYNVTMLI